MEQNEKNPNEYGYVGNETVEMEAGKFMGMKGLVDFALAKETKKYFPEKYKYVNKDTGATIKTVTEKNKHLAVKIVDVEATLNSAPVIFRTEEGIEMLRVRMMAEGVHVDMIDKGVAKHKSFFENNIKSFQENAQESVEESISEDVVEGELIVEGSTQG